MAGKVLIVMPTYNEIDNLPRMLPALEALNLGLEILIIDDGSPDGTGNWVKGQQTTRPHLHLIERSGKLGLGSAYVRGFRFALEKGYDFVFEMDADFSHDPSYIPEFLETIKECDLVLGSRYINGVTVVNWPSFTCAKSEGFSLASMINSLLVGNSSITTSPIRTLAMELVMNKVVPTGGW